jgi:hypothetical protein
MKNLKLIIALFLMLVFANQVKAQDQLEILFTIGDTIETVNIPSNIRTVFVTVSDSSVAGVDTISVLALTKSTRGLKSPIATHSINATAPTTYIANPIVAGNGLTVTYSFDAQAVPGGLFEICRLNESTDDLYAPKTRISVNFK